jgi:hypothetical protein
MLENMNKNLRYELRLDTAHAQNRKFIMSYNLSRDTVTIYEKAQRNSGVIGGKFLNSIRATKPGSTVDSPVFYTPGDLLVGSKIEVFGHRFVVVDCDVYVLKYLQSMSEGSVPLATINSIRVKHNKKPLDNFETYQEYEEEE